MSSNFPPGCSANDIPGNRPEDEAWERVVDWFIEYSSETDLTPEEIKRAVLMGIAAVKAEAKIIGNMINAAYYDGSRNG